MKKIFQLIALLFAFTYLHAQSPKIEKSEAFDEPTEGWNKVFQLTNGNTFFFHFTKRDGIDVSVFDKSRKLIANKTLSSEVWNPRKMKNSVIEGLYEINGEPVLFLMQTEGKVPVLYRIRLDPMTADIVKESKLGSLPKPDIFSFNAEGDDIFVEKDPGSDNYAIIYFNGYAKDKSEQIRVVHYNGKHKVINKAYYDSPDENFKYLRFIGAIVDGDKSVYMATYGASSLKGKDGHVFVARLDAKDSVFYNRTLDFTEDFKDTKSVMSYNHYNNTIQLLTLSYTTGKNHFFSGSRTSYYLSLISYIEPGSLNLLSVKPVLGEKINDYVHTKLGLDENYNGLSQQMIINKDKTTTILSEEMAEEKVVDQRGNVVSATTFLGAIGVSELNEDGTERKGYLMVKKQAAAGILKPLYIATRAKGKWSNQMGYALHNSFLSYDYISTEKNRYILFNDNPRNIDKDEDEIKRRLVTGVNKLNTVCYSLPSLDKFYLFGNPESKDVSNACYIEASDYNKNNDTYATILIERNGHDRQARMVWINFE